MERNYLSYPVNDNSVLDYKNYKTIKEMDQPLNDYLHPIYQYTYNENAYSNKSDARNNYHKDIGLYSIQRSKEYVKEGRPRMNSLSEREHINIPPIILKEKVNENILKPNILHLNSSTKYQRRIKPPSTNPNFDEVRSGNLLESRDAPEYLRNYDKEKLSEIDKYNIETNKNSTYLSRFGKWITLRPGVKDRKLALENVKYGTYETSLVAPEWMDIHSKNKDIICKNKENNVFRSFQWNNTCKDKTKVTMLIEKDQKNAIPLYLRDSFERYKKEC